MKGKNQSYLKEENTSVILKLVRARPGISRADIVRVSGLTAPTVSRLTSFLVQNGIVREHKAKISSVGRKPFGLYFNENAFYIIGVDFSYLHITGALVNLSGKIIEEKTVFINSKSFSVNDLSKVAAIIKSLMKDKDNILGVGFASPGMINHDKGVVIQIPHFPMFKNVPIKKLIEKKFHLHTIVANDANAEAIREKHFGFGKDASDFVLLHLGYGIGMGIIIQNKLYTGNFGVSGEIGHTSIDRRKGRKCDCGNRGCVELYAGLKGILRDVSIATNQKVSSVDDLKKFVKAGDKRVLQILKEKGELVGYVLVNVVNLIAPQKIIVTGSVASIEDPIIKPMKDVIDKRSFYEIGKKIPLVISKMGKDCTIIGAATMVLERFLEKPYSFFHS